MNHLKVFGSVCYKHVPDARTKKLDNKSETLIMVSYHKTCAYILFNPIIEKITIIRYITTDENDAWN